MVAAPLKAAAALSGRPCGFSGTRPPTSSSRGAAHPRLGAAPRRTPRSSRRETPVDGHADRERRDAERHRRAGDTREPLRLGGDHNERQDETSAECEQGGFGIAHRLRP